MVHAQVRLANASYDKILKTFNVAKCNASSIYGTCRGWSISTFPPSFRTGVSSPFLALETWEERAEYTYELTTLRNSRLP